jgi:hypothetical protein
VGTREVLEQTGAQLDRYGWGKAPFPGGKICLAIALSQAAPGLTIGNHAYLAVRKQIAMLFPDRHVGGAYYIADFNDHPDTTEEDIRLVLKHALEDEE